jgi:Tfp pilus assembly protein PilX
MKKYERGQVLLIVVLVMMVVLVIVFSLASRTITEVRLGTEQETSQRAFSAAEAGIEKALQESTGASGSFDNDATYQTTIAAISGVNLLLNNGNPILKNDIGDVWLSTYPGYTNPWIGTVLTVYWGAASDVCSTNAATNTMAALEILVITGTKANPSVTHYPVDPCSARAAANRFEAIGAGGGTVEGKQFAFRKTINITSGILMRIVPLYSSTIIGIRGCNAVGGACTSLPSQGKLITSVGTSDTTQRKIVGIVENPKIPMQFFPYIIFAPR